MKKIYILFALAFFLHKPVLGQLIRINEHWQFTKLESANTNTAVIANQGRDWASQYTPKYVEEHTALSVSADTLKKEFDLLRSAQWQEVNLPHTSNVEPLVELHQWQGICYYRKDVEFRKEWQGKTVYLEFEGAMQLADVWVNGKHVMQHAGGYTPFVVDLSKICNVGEKNEILVRLDNRDNASIPPGKPVSKLDFCYYGGIYRDVNIIVKSPLHITHSIKADRVAGGGVFVTYSNVSNKSAQVNINTNIENEGGETRSFVLRQSLYKTKRTEDLRSAPAELVVNNDITIFIKGNDQIQQKQQFAVKNPNLWSVDSPYLYILKSQVILNGKVVDEENTRIGIRDICFSRDKGFLLNGKPLRLVGSNRHMEYPYLGNAISDNAQYRDIYNIKRSGFNIVRLGHYPQDPSVLDACDELGLLAIEPIPGWQFFNKDTVFTALTYRDTRDLIRRDRNHPSIVMWEITLNESWPPKWWKDKIIAIAHQEYPGNQFYASGDTYGYFGYDVTYNDWEDGFNRPNNSGKPGFIREYYDYEFGGHYSTTRKCRGDGEYALLQNAWNAQWSHNRYRAYYPWTTGDAVWSMYDYNRGCCDNICYSGVADIFRLPKFSTYFYTSQISVGTPLPAGKMKSYVNINSYWSAPLMGNNLIVYGNVDEVALEVNGKIVGKQKPDHGPSTLYSADEKGWDTGGNPFDGGNCENLTHPPFTFNNIQWAEGSVKAIGYIKGQKVTEQTVKTPSKPETIKIEVFEEGRPAGVMDDLIVYAKVLDANGTLCTSYSDEVMLTAVGDAEVIGPKSIHAEAGIASFIVKTGIKGGRIMLNGTSSFLKGSMTIDVKPSKAN
jgi:beta-galactosidase